MEADIAIASRDEDLNKKAAEDIKNEFGGKALVLSVMSKKSIKSRQWLSRYWILGVG